MKHPIKKIAFNEEWALRVGKDAFVAALKEVYPDTDLGAEYDKISPAKIDEKPVKAAGGK